MGRGKSEVFPVMGVSGEQERAPDWRCNGHSVAAARLRLDAGDAALPGGCNGGLQGPLAKWVLAACPPAHILRAAEALRHSTGTSLIQPGRGESAPSMQRGDPSDFQPADAAAMDQCDDQHAVRGLLVQDDVAFVLVAPQTQCDGIGSAAKLRITGKEREAALKVKLVPLRLR